jgi:F-type H+-transporting ATPase subunit gamma
LASQKDTKDRIGSVKNIQKITRAMEMVAAARLRRAEQRIEALRPYARGIRMMTRRAVEAAENIPGMPVLQDRENVRRVGLVLVTGDRGLAGAFNSQIIRAGIRRKKELEAEGAEVSFYAAGRRGVSSMTFRGEDLLGSYTGFTDRPGFANAREIAQDVVTAYADEKLDRAEIIFNHYISPLTQEVENNVLLPIQRIEDVIEDDDPEEEQEQHEHREGEPHAQWLYEPDPEEILQRLVTDYVEISVFRALLESTASEHGARMTAMRNASQNAGELIEDLTLEMNRQRQAEITQEIMEVVAGAEGLR